MAMKIASVDVETVYFLQSDDVVNTKYYPPVLKRGPAYKVTHRTFSKGYPDQWMVESDKFNHYHLCDAQGPTHKRVLAELQSLLAAKAAE